MKKLILSKRVLLMLIAVICGGWLSEVSAQRGWQQMEPLPIVTTEFAWCSIDTMIYIFGGRGDSPTGKPRDRSRYTYARVYNTKTDEWLDLAPVPLNLFDAAAEVINNKIYLTGGWHYNIVYHPVDSTFEYDPAVDSWSSRKSLPAEKASHASCVVNDTLYNIGGWMDWPMNNTSGQRQVKVYDPESDTWDSIPNTIYQHGYRASSCVIHDTIYVFGGAEGSLPNNAYFINKAEMYDPVMKEWTELPDIPVSGAGINAHISVVHENKIYLFGGEIGTDWGLDNYTSNAIFEYAPSTQTWKRMQDMPFSLSDMAGEIIGDFVYLIGGEESSNSIKAEVWRFNMKSLTNIDMRGLANQIKIFPNPTGNFLNIETYHFDHYAIEITSLNGQQILTGEMEGTSHQIDLSSFRNGIYLITIRSKDIVKTNKLIKL